MARAMATAAAAMPLRNACMTSPSAVVLPQGYYRRRRVRSRPLATCPRRAGCLHDRSAAAILVGVAHIAHDLSM